MVDIWLSLLEPWNSNDRLYSKNTFETISNTTTTTAAAIKTSTRNTLKSAASVLSKKMNRKERNSYNNEWEYYVENHYPVLYIILLSNSFMFYY